MKNYFILKIVLLVKILMVTFKERLNVYQILLVCSFVYLCINLYVYGFRLYCITSD